MIRAFVVDDEPLAVKRLARMLWFGGRALMRLKDTQLTELQVARERVAELKKKLGIQLSSSGC